jgi:hypothetical protein
MNGSYAGFMKSTLMMFRGFLVLCFSCRPLSEAEFAYPHAVDLDEPPHIDLGTYWDPVFWKS